MHNYLPGDLLTRPKLGFILHLGVFIGSNQVFHNTPTKGEHVSTVEEFAAGQQIVVQPTKASRSTVLSNAWRMMTKLNRYHLFNRNCEHTAYESIEGKPRSPQLFIILGVILAGIIVWLWSRSK
jgi:hypothetical protein